MDSNLEINLSEMSDERLTDRYTSLMNKYLYFSKMGGNPNLLNQLENLIALVSMEINDRRVKADMEVEEKYQKSVGLNEYTVLDTEKSLELNRRPKEVERKKDGKR